MTQIELMQVALDLSKDFKFTAKPNPVVGALVVRNGEIVAQGAHESWGKNHAEINCLNNLDKSLPKDELTLYVTLEPCNHFGKTPPCTNAIIQSGIKKVVIGALDPNPKYFITKDNLMTFEFIHKPRVLKIEDDLEKSGDKLPTFYDTYQGYKSQIENVKEELYLAIKWIRGMCSNRKARRTYGVRENFAASVMSYEEYIKDEGRRERLKMVSSDVL